VIASHSAVAGRQEIDWYSFLDRPRLPIPALDSLDPLRHASILVTGAGGSIGSALSMRLAALGCKELLLLDSSEQSLHHLQSTLNSAQLPTRPRLLLGNAGDAALLTEIFDACQPRFIFHAAAYKHVPLLEEHPLEAIANNALSTFTLAECAKRLDGVRLVLLSTDKAVEPVSILGATKRIAELITVANAGVVLRLGNVLGTEGSVSETFLHQIANGGPITITGREQRRYFLTCEEAVDLLLLAGVEAPAGAILAPAIDRQYSIESLADFLVTAIAPGQIVPLLKAGPRSGDKPYEKLWSSAEEPIRAERLGYLELRYWLNESAHEGVATDLPALLAAVSGRDRIAAMEVVRRLVPDYVPSTALSSLLTGALQS
jgi:FlaA1/EpsC-like NDP-sugar epimerase